MSLYFDPQTNKYPYPIDTDKHYLVVKKNDGTIFDENYPYIDNTKGFRFKCWLTRVLLVLIVFPLSYVRLGLKVKGKKNLKKYKDVIKNGIVSCSNHVHMWDYISVMNAIKPIKPHLLVWAPNVSGEMGSMVRHVGGIPIPEHNLKATAKYMNVIKDYLNNGGWLHIYPEGSMWEYYAPIRPFKVGASYFASASNKPIIPLGFSYRKPGWIRRVIFKQIALFNLTIGEPLYPNNALSLKAREIDLTKRCHEVICRLATIDPENNIYQPLFNNSKRIDYYTSEYGIGYKGSK
ncbi:MAG: 1-acyl-sn-glycerol-3-phosphate acyltransferase [Bacilli bacterium]|nr:1-acyl-sn-glycerol-3-phosphate acyltransferase [Bacilli bacterium]